MNTADLMDLEMIYHHLLEQLILLVLKGPQTRHWLRDFQQTKTGLIYLEWQFTYYNFKPNLNLFHLYSSEQILHDGSWQSI